MYYYMTNNNDDASTGSRPSSRQGRQAALDKWCDENPDNQACDCDRIFRDLMDLHLTSNVPAWRLETLDEWSKYNEEKKEYDIAVLGWEKERLKNEVDLLWSIKSSTSHAEDRKEEYSGWKDDCGAGHTLGGFFRGAPAKDSPLLDQGADSNWGRCHEALHDEQPRECESRGPSNDKNASDDGNFTGKPEYPGLPGLWGGKDPKGFRTRTDWRNGVYQGHNDEWITIGTAANPHLPRTKTDAIRQVETWAPICKAPGPRPDAPRPRHPQQKDTRTPDPNYYRLHKFCRNLVPNIRENYNGKNPCSFENVNKRGGNLFNRDLEDGESCEGVFTGGTDHPNYPKELVKANITDCSKIFKFNQIGTNIRGELACPTKNGCTYHRALDEDEKNKCVFSYGYNFPEQNLKFALQTEDKPSRAREGRDPNGTPWKWVVGAQDADEDKIMRSFARATETTEDDKLCGIMVDFPMWDGRTEDWSHTKCTKRDYSKPIWHSFSLEGAGWGGLGADDFDSAKSVYESSVHDDPKDTDIYGRRLNKQRKWKGAGHGDEVSGGAPDDAECDSCAQDALNASNTDGAFAELSFEGRYNHSAAHWGNPAGYQHSGGRAFHDECRHPANYIKRTNDRAYTTTPSTSSPGKRRPTAHTDPDLPELPEQPSPTGSITKVQCCANVINAKHADLSDIEQECTQGIRSAMAGEPSTITPETVEEKRNLLENMKKKSKEALNKIQKNLNEKFGSKLKDKFGLDEDSNILLYIVLAIIVILIGVGGYLWYRWKKKK